MITSLFTYILLASALYTFAYPIHIIASISLVKERVDSVYSGTDSGFREESIRVYVKKRVYSVFTAIWIMAFIVTTIGIFKFML